MERSDLTRALLALIAMPLAAAGQEGRFAAADADRNGVLSRAEVERSLPRLALRFDAIDRNRDGSLSPDELRAHARVRKAPDRSPTGEGGFAGHFRRADADGDGALTRAEAAEGLPRLAAKFDLLDANRDGRLTQDELRRYFDAKRAARGKGASG